MAGSNILSEFLVAIGWKIDEQSYRVFQNRFNATIEQFRNLGKIAAGASVAMSTSVLKTASDMEKLYFAAQRAGSSASGLQALQFAAQQVGIGADEVTSSVQGMASAVRTNPGLVTFFKSLGLNYDTKDTIKDFTNLLERLTELSAKGPWGHMFATQIADRFGIDEQTLTQYEGNLPDLLEDLQEFQQQQKAGKAGFLTDDQVQQFHQFMEEWRGFEIDAERLATTFGYDVLPYAIKIVEAMKKAVDYALELDKKTGGKSTEIGGVAAALGTGYAAKAVASRVLRGVLGGGGAVAGGEISSGGLALPITASIAAGVMLAKRQDPVLSLVKKAESYFSKTDPVVSQIASMIIGLEGLGPKGLGGAYRDIAGNVTVGFGHMVQRGESFAGGLTQTGAMKLLSSDTAKALTAVQKYVKVAIGHNQLAALTDLVFNIGSGAFSRSTLLRDLNSGNFSAAADEFLRWNKVHTASGGMAASSGLTNRRLGDRALFLKPDVSINQTTTIHVAGSDKPKDTARAVSIEQRRVNADIVRNAQGALQ